MHTAGKAEFDKNVVHDIEVQMIPELPLFAFSTAVTSFMLLNDNLWPHQISNAQNRSLWLAPSLNHWWEKKKMDFARYVGGAACMHLWLCVLEYILVGHVKEVHPFF